MYQKIQKEYKNANKVKKQLENAGYKVAQGRAVDMSDEQMIDALGITL